MHNGRPVAASQVIVQLRADTPAGLARVIMDSDGDKAERLRNNQPVFVIRSRSKRVDALVTALSRSADVLRVEPDYILRGTAIPNDPYYSNLWALANTGQSILGGAGIAGADIRSQAAWDTTKGSTSTVVGVIDSGIDYNHPDLAANMWSAPRAFTVNLGGTSITCPAGSHGFDTITRTCDPMDTNGHGTHVAGTIGAVGNNGVGVSGVNWTGSLMALRILDSTGSGSTSDAIIAIEFAIQAHAQFGAAANVRVLSASWGGDAAPAALQDAIANAGSAGMLFVAAAGNSGRDDDLTPFYPASFPLANIVSVAATDNRDALAAFSNYGANSVDIAAPGVNILSTVPGAAYGWKTGTSMATPHVSGAAALILSKCTLETAALRALLLNNSDRIAGLAGRMASGGRLNVQRALAACSGSTTAPAPPPPAAGTARFVQADTGTSGNWKGVYGSEGYAIPTIGASYPSWATVTPSSEWLTYAWANPTLDTRGLQRPGGTDRFATCWYQTATATFSVRITDGAVHRVAFYALDWDRLNRTQRVEVLDAASGAVLDTRNLSGFTNGVYLVWDLSGSVLIRLVNTGATHAVVSALFFGDGGTAAAPPPAATPNPTPGTSARFLQSDTTTRGNWKGVYGGEGYSIATVGVLSPSWASVTPSPEWLSYSWANPTADLRGLQRPGGTDRLATCWYQAGSATFSVRITDGAVHRVALYALDWDRINRTQRIEVVDAASGAVLDTRNVSAFINGVYLVWDLSGSVLIRVVNTGAAQAVVSALFFGAPGTAPSPSPGASSAARFVNADTTTSGNWKGVYGGNGYSIATSGPSYPSWATVATGSEWLTYAWANPAWETRALQRPGGTDRFATCWYQTGSATFTVNITDGAAHRVALYALDWDRLNRTQRVEVLDASSGAVLDTRNLSAFANGVYLVWDLSGSVVIRVVNTGTTHAVVSGLFFGAP